MYNLLGARDSVPASRRGAVFDDPKLWLFKRLDATDDVEGFHCGDDPWHREVAEFLVDDALEQQGYGYNNTYLVMYDGQLMGFVCLIATSFQFGRDETGLDAAPGVAEVGRDRIPCVLIGQMGVCTPFQGQGVGARIMEWIIGAVVDGAVGARFLVLNVSRQNERARRAWKSYGFVRSEGLSGNTDLWMYYDLYGALAKAK